MAWVWLQLGGVTVLWCGCIFIVTVVMEICVAKDTVAMETCVAIVLQLYVVVIALTLLSWRYVLQFCCNCTEVLL